MAQTLLVRFAVDICCTTKYVFITYMYLENHTANSSIFVHYMYVCSHGSHVLRWRCDTLMHLSGFVDNVVMFNYASCVVCCYLLSGKRIALQPKLLHRFQPNCTQTQDEHQVYTAS